MLLLANIIQIAQCYLLSLGPVWKPLD